jgi:hypothetical protein
MRQVKTQGFNIRLQEAINNAENEAKEKLFKLREEKLPLFEKILEKVEKTIFSEPFVLFEPLEKLLNEKWCREILIKIKDHNSLEISITKDSTEWTTTFFVSTYLKGVFLPSKLLFIANYSIPTAKAVDFKLKPGKSVVFNEKKVTKADLQKAIKIMDQSKKIEAKLKIEI